MDNIEIMNKLNNIFIEASANDIIDVFEANEYINTSIDLFSPDYICEAEESDMTDEEKEAKERAKKTRKKIIKLLAVCTACLTAIGAIRIYSNHKIQKELKERKQYVLNIKKELRKYLNKDTLTINDIEFIGNINIELIKNRTAINQLIAYNKKKKKENYNLMKNQNKIANNGIDTINKITVRV